MIIDKHNQGWAEYTNNLEKDNKHLRGLLRSVIEQEGNLPHQGCKCSVCELYREIGKELENE